MLKTGYAKCVPAVRRCSRGTPLWAGASLDAPAKDELVTPFRGIGICWKKACHDDGANERKTEVSGAYVRY
jgi:hypothetical protein